MKEKFFESSEAYEPKFQDIKLTSPYCQFYRKHMTLIDKQSEQFIAMLKELKQNGFKYSEQFSYQFKKTIVKSSRDSVEYQIEYGNFKTFIYASFALYNFKRVYRQEIDSGRFGKILLFIYNQQPIIVKSFPIQRNNSLQFQNILKELFWVKFASILKIGPKFMNIYGYDLICLKESYEFTMQECNSDLRFTEIQRQMMIERMKSIITIVHSFNAIHGDIKPSHIAWSPRQENIVILDFGMTKFLREKIGEMTQTQYFGTFCYSCLDMKKAYILKSAVFVDLFYNDLFAFLQFKKQIGQLYLATSTKKNKKQKECAWKQVVILFKFKFNLFINQNQQIKKICRQQKQLSLCFRYLLKIEQNYILNQVSPKLFILLKQQLKQQPTKQLKQQLNQQNSLEIKNQSIRQLVYLEILKFHNQPVFCRFYISETLIKNMFDNKTLQNFISSNQGLQSIFQFIFQPKKLEKYQIIERKKTAKYIYLTINQKVTPEVELVESQMILSVLLMFQNHFCRTGNLEKLIYIESIFRFTCEIKLLKKVQGKICQVFLKNPDLWFRHYTKIINFLLEALYIGINTKSNPRKNWEWLTTYPSIRSKFLKQNNSQLVLTCASMIQQIDLKLSSAQLNLSYDQNKYKRALKKYKKLHISQQKIGLQNISKTQNQNNCPRNFQPFEKKQIAIQRFLYFGIIKWQYQKQYAQFMSTFDSLGYILRQTVWSLVYFVKNENIKQFQRCLEKLFDQIFVSDMSEGIHIFVMFSRIFRVVISLSKKTKQLMIHFLENMKIVSILQQISDSPYSLKQFILNFVEIMKFFANTLFNQQKVFAILDPALIQIIQFCQSNRDKWWAVSESELFVLCEICQIYYQAFKNGWVQNVRKMIELAKKLFYKKYSMIVFSFIIIEISQIVISHFSGSISLIWEVIKNIEDKELFFAIIERNINFFLMIIRKLSANQQFQECLYLLEEYGKQVRILNYYFNDSNIYIFQNFIQILPKNVAVKMFINKLGLYTFERINQSPRLSFLFFFLLASKPFLLKNDDKKRCIKLISFGLGKINIRYNNYIKINGYLLRFHRLYMGLINSRKKRMHFQLEARVSHFLSLKNKLFISKQRKCRRLQTKYFIKNNLLEKLNRGIILTFMNNHEEQLQIQKQKIHQKIQIKIDGRQVL